MTEFTEEQINRLSSSLLEEMISAHQESVNGDPETIKLAQNELAIRSIKSMLPETAKYVSGKCDSDISPDSDFH
mgnify:CR=1 FL=1|jgi:hypothetical protein